MKTAIQAIISKIPKNATFDSHTIIFKLIQDFSDVYLKEYNGKGTKLYHGEIGKLVAGFENDPKYPIKRLGNSWSKNILNRYSSCACWKKL